MLSRMEGCSEIERMLREERERREGGGGQQGRGQVRYILLEIQGPTGPSF